MTNIVPLLYSREDLAASWEDLDGKQAEIDKQSLEVGKERKSLEDRTAELEKLQQEEKLFQINLERYGADLTAQGLNDRINVLTAEIGELHKKIDDLSGKNATAQSAIKPIDDNIKRMEAKNKTGNLAFQQAQEKVLKQEYAKRFPLQNEIEGNQEEIKRHLSTIAGLELSLAAVKGEFNLAVAQLSEPFAVKDAAEVDKKITECDRELREHKVRIEEKSKHVEALKLIVKAGEAALRALQERKFELESNEFLIGMRHHPDIMLRQLRDSLRDELQNFELKYPAGQSVNVRICLRTLNSKADFIVNNNDFTNPNDPETLRFKYCQLSGLLWSAHILTQNEENQFSTFLEKIRGDRAISAEEGLDAYEKLKEKCNNPVLQDMSDSELEKMELAEYKNALHDFEDATGDDVDDEKKSLREAGAGLVESIKEYKRTYKASHPFDMKYYTNILQSANDVLREPEKREYRDKLGDIGLHNTDGKSSAPRRIVGAILMCLGGALAIASSVVMAMALPVLSWPFCVGGIAVGVIAFGLGIASLFTGREKGVEKSLHNYSSALQSLSMFKDKGIASDSELTEEEQPGFSPA